MEIIVAIMHPWRFLKWVFPMRMRNVDRDGEACVESMARKRKAPVEDMRSETETEWDSTEELDDSAFPSSDFCDAEQAGEGSGCELAGPSTSTGVGGGRRSQRLAKRKEEQREEEQREEEQEGEEERVVKKRVVKKRRKEQKQEVEKRVDDEGRTVRYRAAPCVKVKERMARALPGSAHRMFLIDRRVVVPAGGEGGGSEEFMILGGTGNVYKVKICRQPCCDCPDFLNGNHCKHILFVLLRVLGLPDTDHVVWQRALLSEEVRLELDVGGAVSECTRRSGGEQHVGWAAP